VDVRFRKGDKKNCARELHGVPGGRGNGAGGDGGGRIPEIKKEKGEREGET